MGPESRNPLEKKLEKTSKREGLKRPDAEPRPTYLVIREGSELQKTLAEKLERARLLNEPIHEIGPAKPTGEQAEVIPQSPVDEDFLKTLPQGREFILYANTPDIMVEIEQLPLLLRQNTMVILESDQRLVDELTAGQGGD